MTQLALRRDPRAAAEVTLASPRGQRRGDHLLVDPRTGTILGHATGETFFRMVIDVHRWLALPGGANGIGRQITGFAAVALIFFALSGLYLHWPRRPLDWRAWLALDLRKSGRNLYRALHTIVGSWIVMFHSLSALTGLTWSYDWYRQGARFVLTDKAGSAREERSQGTVSPLPLAAAWDTFLRSDGTRYARVAITLPRGDAPVAIRMLPKGARFDRMTDELRFDAPTGDLIKADRRPGEVIAGQFHALHTGRFFGLPGRVVMLPSSLAMPLFTITGLLLYLGRRHARPDPRRGPGGELVVLAS